MEHIVTLPLEPCSAPRQVQSDRWKSRPCVERYRAFRDQVNCLLPDNFQLPDGFLVIFHLPMPSSWSGKKKRQHYGTLHRSKPDTDNLCKALFDSIYRDKNDSEVADYRAIKLWAYEGAIALYQMPAFDYSMFVERGKAA